MKHPRITLGLFGGAVFASLLMTGCPPAEPGEVANEISETLDFVEDDDVVLVVSPRSLGGVTRVGVDGSAPEEILSDAYRLHSVALDESLWAYGDSSQNLYLLQPGEAPQQIAELDGRLFLAAVSPEGSRVAVSRDVNRSLPVAERSSDDHLYLIDGDTFAVEELEGQGEDPFTRLAWSKDGTQLYGETSQAIYSIDPETHEREALSAWPSDEVYPLPMIPAAEDAFYPRVGNSETCANASDETFVLESGGTTLDVRRDGGASETLVTIEGGQDSDPFDSYAFTSSCRYVVFDFNDTIWVADVETQLVARLMEGRTARVLPRLETAVEF